MEYYSEDLEILKKETKLQHIEAERLLKECNNDVVAALLKHSGDDKYIHSDNNIKELSEPQKKIELLRTIVDKKDEMMDKILEKQRKK